MDWNISFFYPHSLPPPHITLLVKNILHILFKFCKVPNYISIKKFKIPKVCQIHIIICILATKWWGFFTKKHLFLVKGKLSSRSVMQHEHKVVITVFHNNFLTILNSSWQIQQPKLICLTWLQLLHRIWMDACLLNSWDQFRFLRNCPPTPPLSYH